MVIGKTEIRRPRLRSVAFYTLLAMAITLTVNMTGFYFVKPEVWPYVLVASVITPLIVTPPLSYQSAQQREKLRAAYGEINRLLQVDELSGLNNRRHLNDILKGAHADELLSGPTCVLMVDIDNFKRVNDTFGHAGGDEVIIVLARILRKACRSEDHIFRLGGEEFCILLPSVNKAKGQRVAERIRRMTASITELEAIGPISFTVSIGMTMLQPGKDLSHAMRVADKAMYRAKELGRNRLVLGKAKAA